jgi:hypothetical protein
VRIAYETLSTTLRLLLNLLGAGMACAAENQVVPMRGQQRLRRLAGLLLTCFRSHRPRYSSCSLGASVFSCKGGSAKNVHQQVSDHPAAHKISGNERKPVAGQLVDAAQSFPQPLYLSGLAFKGVGGGRV